MNIKTTLLIIALSIALNGCISQDDEKVASELLRESESIYYAAKKKTGEYKNQINEYEKSYVYINRIKNDYSETSVASSKEIYGLERLIDEAMEHSVRFLKKTQATVRNPLHKIR